MLIIMPLSLALPDRSQPILRGDRNERTATDNIVAAILPDRLAAIKENRPLLMRDYRKQVGTIS